MRPEEESALRQDGDSYHSRNYSGIGTIADPIFEAMCVVHASSPIRRVLEIGCTTGFRLEKARAAFNARCVGLEISPVAVSEGHQKYPQVEIQEGVAPRDLDRWADAEFDLIIVGHLQYLLPRESLFAFASQVDRLLTPGGHIVLMDFLSPTPVSAAYSHHANLTVFKHDPSELWLWSPTYVLVARRVYDISADPKACRDPRMWQTVDTVRKLAITEAYPSAPTIPSIHETGSR
jgi:SAM-dependent methyltransferase